ncbi:hypothetical protein NQ318_013700 [Aromia moschata]|uniref:Uncharacterized protein n=1 Tax=Aromia moschata TaxID=1265417 RepID=A0AAV8Z8V1_9CUCU|nr:hypothetical protein NQ318_013700 [Aromia moschata]
MHAHGIIKIEGLYLPDDKSAGLFFGRLPKPELPLAIEPAREPLENSSDLCSLEASSADTCLCFRDGEGLQKKQTFLTKTVALNVYNEQDSA